MKSRFVRPGDVLDDDRDVVRGGILDVELLRVDARRMHAVYGVYGISVFALREVTLDELAQQPPLVRFDRLTLLTVGTIRAAGLRLEPTGRNRRHFTVVFDELDAGVAALASCQHRVWDNPYHEP